MKLQYMLLDVFTSQRLKGNPLAVVLNGDGLLDDEMQAVASEFNLSETVFIRKPRSEKSTAAVRIFTPTVELPFAGHPTVGVAVVLGALHKLQVVRIEEQVGLITALVQRIDRTTSEARFGLPKLPWEVAPAPQARAIASALGIEEHDIGCGQFGPAVYSAGLTFYLVPVRDSKVLAQVQMQRLFWPQTFPLDHHSVYVFTETPTEPDNDLAARMFSPDIGEDPGTGSAAAALIGLLARNEITDSGQRDLVLRQGHEMGRPCRILLQMRKEGGLLSHGGIGGQAVVIGQGELDLGD